MEHVVKWVLTNAGRSSIIRRASEYVVRTSSQPLDSYRYLRERFIANGRSHAVNTSERKRLLARFELIDNQLPMATTPTDGLILAEMLLNLTADGSIVECGCFSGGSSAKLSILAKLLGRELLVCDSFEGLPATNNYYLRDHHCRRGERWMSDWSKGRYAATLDVVKRNIETHGEPSVCSFVKGWFADTLTSANLPDKVALAFVDVDLADSARDCITAIWPILSENGVFVTHDTAFIKVLQEFYNPDLWQNKLKSFPPILFGGGFGLYDSSPHIGYMVKGDQLSPSYLKELTIDK